MKKRIVSTDIQTEDNEIDSTIRPINLADYIGQTEAKETLKIFIEAAIKRQEALDHVLLYGPPGLGKTTLAGVIAYEMKVNFKVTSGPAIEKPGDIVAILNTLQNGDILFIDEIHRIPRYIEEMLYTAMEDYAIDIMVGKGPSAKPIRINLPKFTLIGATTRAGLLSAPLRDRFGIIQRLEFYSLEELAQILIRTGNILNTEVELKAGLAIAKCSRGTPRLANRFLKRVRDIIYIKYNTNIISLDNAILSLELLNLDQNGLDTLDRRILNTIANFFGGGPVGLDTLAATLSEERETLEDVYEPYLLQKGLIMRTARGRVLTQEAYYILGIDKKIS
ncbi:Holliday junction DNA helicase RuvB [Candidatus Epulonipiscium fishelsonii]|uniref:Holliday junction DNA helicase RuvB n=1 Tax=Candidatus Epulonipiscium fishelsonii TaxID=77094 RepID=A0ACC8XFN8_9FIRM|nr:Holliday junction DNA helicase RuvB [Epulopiscium sp. SCG-B11WGA-EpuloA1]ONI43270.1 Holliday junction DNA helicase RuvB [Epulopiscium sp. SCG-B05WGA-EpuloA1]